MNLRPVFITTVELQFMDYQEVVIPEIFYRGSMFFSGFPLKACGNDKKMQKPGS
jgi:hypothetical protein